MKISRIAIRSWMGLDDLEIHPGALTIISGRNGHGKSSVIEAIKAVGEHEHDPARIRNGAEYAEVELELDNGHIYKMTTRKTRTTWDFVDERGVPIKRTAEHIREIVNSISLDPIQFLGAKPKDQVAMYLSAIPLRVTAKDLEFMPVADLQGVDLDRHALEVIGDKSSGLYGSLYQERTAVNRIAKEKRASATEMRRNLPQDPESGDWDKELAQVTAEMRSLQSSTKTRITGADADMKVASDAAKELFQAKRDGVMEELHETIERRRADLEKQIAQLRKEYEDGVSRLHADCRVEIERCEKIRDGELERIAQSHKDTLSDLEAGYKPQLAALQESMAKAKTMVEQRASVAKTREFIAAQEKQAKESESTSELLTRKLERLESLKSRLIASSPVPGLEVTAEGLELDGVSLRVTNKAKQFEVAFRIGMLQAGELGVMVVDDLEHLVGDNYEAFKTAAKASGLQVIAARAEDHELEVSNVK